MNKKSIIIAAGVLIVIAGAGWMLSGSEGKSKVEIETTEVKRGDISYSITATGTVEPVTKVDVGTQVSGIIDKLYADYNSLVTKGQVIAEMDRVTLQSELKAKQATYDGAKAEFDYQQKNYTRSRTLHDKGLISDTDYELATNSYEKAKSSYDSSKADLAKAQRNLAYTTITSPIDGIVINRAVEEGQTVAAGFETPTLFTIAADLTQMQVVANVDEADIGGVEEGQRVSFTVDAYPNDTFEGKVTQVRLEATTTSNVVTYEVVISAQNPDLKLKPGLTANVNIYTIDKPNALCVAAKALRFVPDAQLVGQDALIKDCQAKHKLWIRQGNIYTAHPVEVGITNSIQTEIISGIKEGEIVILDAVAGSTLPTEAKADGNADQSPFMPSHPGAKKNGK